MSHAPDHVLLLRCMAAAASADGTLSDEETAALVAVYLRLTGEEVDLDALHNTVETVWARGPRALSYVVSEGRDLDVETRIFIARACYLVMAADGEITGPEAGTFNAILDGLGLSKETVLARL